MRQIVIIPARHGSTRFPGKPLAPLTSSGGITRPLIEWVWRAGVAAAGEDAVIVATDSDEIARAVAVFGGRTAMTSSALRNGTERCAAVLSQLDEQPDVVVNLQGDNPLVPRSCIEQLVEAFADASVEVATPFLVCDGQMQSRILEDHLAGRVGGTCVVCKADRTAAYFSKFPIPFGAGEHLPLKLHLGLYAYRPEALSAYAGLPPSALELAEGLEQLRFLDAGIPIRMIEVPCPEGGLWEVNNPDDVPVVEALLQG